MPMPPIVPGLTQTAQTASPGDLMSQLTQSGAASQDPNGAQLIRDAIGALQKAASVDPRLAERISQAVAMIEGRDPQSVRARESDRGANRIGPVAGNAKTPV